MLANRLIADQPDNTGSDQARLDGVCLLRRPGTSGVMDWLGDVLVWWGASKVPTKIAVWIMALAFAGILIVAAFVLVDKLA